MGRAGLGEDPEAVAEVVAQEQVELVAALELSILRWMLPCPGACQQS